MKKKGGEKEKGPVPAWPWPRSFCRAFCPCSSKVEKRGLPGPLSLNPPLNPGFFSMFRDMEILFPRVISPQKMLISYKKPHPLNDCNARRSGLASSDEASKGSVLFWAVEKKPCTPVSERRNRSLLDRPDVRRLSDRPRTRQALGCARSWCHSGG